MGSTVSKKIWICGTKKSKKSGQPDDDHNGGTTGDQMQDFDDGGVIENNKDNYFSKDDYDKITRKFPNWMSQSLMVSKVRPRQKRIKWKEGEIIGHGSFGRVVIGLNLQTGSIMAVKQVQIGSSNTPAQQERIKALEIEIELLSQLSHKNIVRYYGSHKSKTTFNIFLEYISGGTIASLIEKYGPLNENLARVYARQILEGLEYLHIRNTIHRDIKGANVLVDNSGVCKLADFGTAKRISSIVDNELRYMPSIRGTVNWMAPEVIKQTNLGRGSDIWSVGCTVLEMVTGKVPWSNLMKPGATQVSALYQIASSKSHPPLPEGLSAEAIDFLKQCFKINPAERPNVMKLLGHPFISGGQLTKPLPLSDLEKQKAAAGKAPLSASKFKKAGSDSLIKASGEKEKEKEKEKTEKDNSKKRSSFSRFRRGSHQHDSGDNLPTASPLLRNIEKENQRAHKNNLKKVGSDPKMVPQEKQQQDLAKKPKFHLRSLADVNNSNFDASNIDDKLLKNERHLSNPEHSGYDNTPLASNHMNMPAELPQKETIYKFGTNDLTELKNVEPQEVDIVAREKIKPIPVSSRGVRTRPLGKPENPSSIKVTGPEDDSSHSHMDMLSRKASDHVTLIEGNSFRIKGKGNIEKIEEEKEEKKSEVKRNRVYTFTTKELEVNAAAQGLKDSRISEDSDIDSSSNNPNRILSSSIKTKDMSDTGTMSEYNKNFLESDGFARKGLSAKYSPIRNIADEIKEVQMEGDTFQDVEGDSGKFKGILMAESGVVKDRRQHRVKKVQDSSNEAHNQGVLGYNKELFGLEDGTSSVGDSYMGKFGTGNLDNNYVR